MSSREGRLGFVVMFNRYFIDRNWLLRSTGSSVAAIVTLATLPIMPAIAQPNHLQISALGTDLLPLLDPNRSPVAVILPVAGKVNVRLVNQTYTTITYNELAGNLEPKKLAGRSTVTLTDLPTPVNLNFYRPDRGFLIVTLQPSPTIPNTLDLTLTETADQGLGKTSLIVNPDGTVYLF
jgi:hypothetical protein